VSDLVGLVVGTLVLRPYVFALLALYLLAATAAWGGRRALTFTALAGGLAFLAEFASTHIGVPFGLYHYTGMTRGRELYLANVPLFDPLSFTFLAYASLGLARLIAGPAGLARSGRWFAQAGLAGLLMMWLDVVIDPLAVRGDRWFLGRIFYYPEPGWYFGVPVANFVGWAVLGGLIAGAWGWLEPRLAARPPRWAWRVPGRPYHAVILYYVVLGFNLALSAAVAEPALFWVGVAAHVPLAALVVSSLASLPSSSDRSYAGEPA
jgi:uncharacterized membrane protein